MNFDVSQLVSLESPACWIFLGILAIVGLIGGWIFYPYTVGAFARSIRSPWKHFTERCGTAFVAAIAVAFVGFKVAQGNLPSSAKGPAIESPKEAAASSEDPFAKNLTSQRHASTVPTLKTEEPASIEKEAPTVSNIESPPVIQEEAVPLVPTKPSQIVQAEVAKVPAKPTADPTVAKVAELKGELAKVNSQIESERGRWTEALNTINQLTNFKKTPVKEGSAAYRQCMAASKVIHEVESGAPTLKAEKARLEAVIEEMSE